MRLMRAVWRLREESSAFVGSNYYNTPAKFSEHTYILMSIWIQEEWL